MTTAIDPNSVSILSPPASPYPDLSSLQQYMKLHYKGETDGVAQAVGRPTPISSSASTPESDSQDANPKGAKMVTCWNSLLADPNQYYERERTLLSLYPTHKQTWSNHVYVENPSEFKRSRTKRVSRARRAATYSTAETDSDAVLAPRRNIEVSDAGASDSDSPKRTTPKKRSPAVSVTRVHDLNISQIEDFSPCSSLLPPGRSLRAEWKGAPMDLSNDPDAHLLHPAELHLASVLRLPAEVYLDSKRRLFAEKVHRMRQGLAFRRTDSQKACRIDVNKASRLFGAFERVGWLDDELFTKHLNQSN